MYRGRTTGSACQWDLDARSALDLSSNLPLSTFTQVFDNSSLHGELDQVKWQEPDDVLFKNKSARAAERSVHF